jgi:hypothetical protein
MKKEAPSKRPLIKKRHPKMLRGSKRPLMKKEAPLKRQ